MILSAFNHYPSIHNPYASHASVLPSSRLIPHRLQMLNDGEIRIQEPVDAVLRTALLVTVQLSAADRARHTFFPAHVGQGVHGYTESRTLLVFVL
jgi:hypothetical protein